MFGTACLFLALAAQSSASIFFHEPSYIALQPKATGDHNTFGFSLAYQQKEAASSLVIGAPHSGLTGKVFQCPIDGILTRTAESRQCGDVGIDVDKIAPYQRDSFPNLKLNLGVSVSATPDYFFSCAPLWPSAGSDAYCGTCFMYNGTVYRYNGVLEQYKAGGELASLNDIKGGTGWRTLIDEENKVLLVAKVALMGDVTVVNSSEPLAPVFSFVSKDANRRYFQDYQNIGSSMVAGNFFSTTQTLYAISSYDSTHIQYTVHFLNAKTSKAKTKLSVFGYTDRTTGKKKNVKVTVGLVGSMFGAAMCAADLDHDGYSELLVGAPAQADGEGGHESGALHIYLGGDADLVTDISRHCVITGIKEGSRFGTAVASSDIDGDDLPEIFVSAPYDGTGTLYILSGFEVNKELIRRTGSKKEISLSKLKYTQVIRNEQFKTFGYSLQVISDLDGNGCNELVVGAPGSDSIMLLRCLPSIVVDVDIEKIGDKIVKEQDENFTLKVCFRVKHLKGKPFSSTLKISNKVIGVMVVIVPHQVNFGLEVNGSMTEPICRDILLQLSDHEPHEYQFYTKVEVSEETIVNSKEFKSTWATLSPISVTEKSIDISRHCSDKDCEPNLTMTIRWSGNNDSYYLGSTELITVTLLVKNEGSSSFDSCVRVKVTGAPIAKFGCSESRDGYKCYMPKPLRRTAEYKIDIMLNMSQPLNLDEEIIVKAHLFDFCDKGIPTNETLNLKLNLVTEDILLDASSHNQDISDREIQDLNDPIINDAHEYLIQNNGSVYWKNINAVIVIPKAPFIESYRVSAPMSNCVSNSLTNRMMFNCTFDLQPRSTAKIIATILVTKSKIKGNLVDEKLNISSYMLLYLIPTPETRVIRLSTSITRQNEESMAQNKPLIIFLAILGAAITLAVLVFVMYKMDFFKRKEKTKLDALKQEHVRRQSVKRPASVSHGRSLDEVNDGLDMEVVDDSPFEILDMTEPVLRKDKEDGM